MKKIYLSILTLVFSSGLVAQTVPNAGFENWYNNTETGSTYQLPQSWIATDMLNRAFNTNYTGAGVTKTTQSHSGTSAALMQTVISGGDTAAGVLFSVNTFAEFIGALFNGTGMGFTCATRPANLTGFYKFTGVSGDYAVVSVLLTKWNTSQGKRDTLGIGSAQVITNAANYTSVTVPVSYALNLFPDTALIIAALQASNNTHVGSMFFLDDLAFTGSVPFGVKQYAQSDQYVSIYPNPFTSSATFQIDPSVSLTNAELIVSDVLGKEVKRLNKVNEQTTLEKGNMEPGIYFYQLINDGMVISNGKFLVE